MIILLMSTFPKKDVLQHASCILQHPPDWWHLLSGCQNFREADISQCLDLCESLFLSRRPAFYLLVTISTGFGRPTEHPQVLGVDLLESGKVKR